jgi:rare lipoprotein A (peptidoglycan hydrolase)
MAATIESGKAPNLWEPAIEIGERWSAGRSMSTGHTAFAAPQKDPISPPLARPELHCTERQSKQQQRSQGKMMAVKSLMNPAFVATMLIALTGISHAQTGIASTYFGGRTANGERTIGSRLTAAHKTLPFGTLVKVTHRRTGKFRGRAHQ